MADEYKSRTEKGLGKVNNLVTNKQSRSIFFMVITFILILLINGLLPVIEGQAHYTVGSVEYEYGQYTQMKAQNKNYELTWTSEQKIEEYIENYLENHPELTEEEAISINVPPNFKVMVLTEFFFQYPFWYVSTGVALFSAVLLFYSLFNYLLVSSKEKYIKYTEMEDKVNGLVDKELDPDTFEPWTDNVFNYNRKITQHEHNVKYLIDKLEKKTKYENKKRFKDYFNEEDEVQKELLAPNLEDLTKKELKYFNKKEELIAKLDPDYIKLYVVDGHVKHFKYIHPMFVYNGTNNIGQTVDGYSLISTDGEQLKSDAGAKVVLSLSITVAFSTLLTLTAVSSAGQAPLWIFINVVAKLAPLLIQVPLAFDYNNSFMKKQLLPNLLNRRNIGLKYLADISKGVDVNPSRKPVEEEPSLEGAYKPVVTFGGGD